MDVIPVSHFCVSIPICRSIRLHQHASEYCLRQKQFMNNTLPLSLSRVAKISLGRENILGIIEMLLDPLILVLTLWSVAFWTEDQLSPPYLLLSIIVFSVTFPGNSYTNQPIHRTFTRVISGWFVIAALLAFFGLATRYIGVFDTDALLTWFWLAPAASIAAHLTLRTMAPLIIKWQGDERPAIIVGMNAQGIELARTIKANPLLAMRVLGFFDDRSLDRLDSKNGFPLLGRLANLGEYVRQNGVKVIYLSLPMSTQPRLLDLLSQLRDTTVSIYFVPDIFITDMIQGRMDMVDGIPVVAVCETPFTGLNGVTKRLSDMVLATLILLLISPLLLLIAIGIKASSPGPVIFKQRRYGLDGKEIIVYKFRSMTVCEDGDVVRQARKDDQRITPLGALLRKTSLDELPQFFNVLQGRMSIVGPRPHAVTHNEQYRKLIKGYMVRHKVKPGITGWAQINGYRGETDTLEKMKKRIEYDLDYLRYWSLRFDLSIIFRTILVIIRDRNAY